MPNANPMAFALIAVGILPSNRMFAVQPAWKDAEATGVTGLAVACAPGAHNRARKAIPLAKHAATEMLFAQTKNEKPDARPRCAFFAEKNELIHRIQSARHVELGNANGRVIIALTAVTAKQLSSAMAACANFAVAKKDFAFITKMERATRIIAIMTMII